MLIPAELSPPGHPWEWEFPTYLTESCCLVFYNLRFTCSQTRTRRAKLTELTRSRMAGELARAASGLATWKLAFNAALGPLTALVRLTAGNASPRMSPQETERLNFGRQIVYARPISVLLALIAVVEQPT